MSDSGPSREWKVVRCPGCGKPRWNNDGDCAVCEVRWRNIVDRDDDEG